LRKMTTFLLQEAGHSVTTADDGREALRIVAEEPVDLVLLDVMMPGLNGLKVAERIRKKYELPIIFLSAKGHTDDRIRGLELGADDYLPKPFDPGELIERVNAVMRRTQTHAMADFSTELRVGELRLDPISNRLIWENGRSIKLTPIEFRLLHALMRNAGRTLTHDLLLESVWGYDADGYSNQISVYMRRLRSKIEDDPANPRYLSTVRGQGYRFESPEAPGLNRSP
ncbi:MAG TPA: response regulator transcription factor, partial [Ardenticatenaceae bacterium]|nr:response regulator transcription factor [Ardenticatenaceae bacterium]